MKASLGFALCSLAFFPWGSSVHAEQLDVDYASFYSHVKKLDDEDTNQLRFGFGFQHIAQGRLCNIEEAAIVTQKQRLPLVVESNQRFTVPTDKVLKMARAIVSIQLNDQSNQCDMSVQLETKPEYLKQAYSHDDLRTLLNQYQAFFSGMGGLFSFMMPSVEGLVIHTQDGQLLGSDLTALTNTNGNIELNEAWFALGKGLQLNTVPTRITALVEK